MNAQLVELALQTALVSNAILREALANYLDTPAGDEHENDRFMHAFYLDKALDPLEQRLNVDIVLSDVGEFAEDFPFKSKHYISDTKLAALLREAEAECMASC